MAKGEDRGLIRDPVADQLDAGKAAHSGHLNKGLFHRRLAQRIPLLEQVNPQHGRQWIGRPPSFLARFGVLGLDQGDQRLPWHHHFYLREKLLPLGLLLVGG